MPKFFQDAANADAIAQILDHYERFPDLYKEQVIGSQITDYSQLAGKHWSCAFGKIILLGKDQDWLRLTGRIDAGEDKAGLQIRDGVLALSAYDDASKYLSLSFDKLKMIATLSDSPAAFLLLPTVLAFEKAQEIVDNKSNL
jgi:hypothetical protein